MALEIKVFKAALDDGRDHPDDFPTVPSGSKVLFKWETKEATSVELVVLADGETVDTRASLEPTGQISLEFTQEVSVRLEAKGAGGQTQSRSVRVHLAELHASSPVAMLSANALDLPLLICGPMLRRVKVEDPAQKAPAKMKVSVFFVAREPVTARLLVQPVADPGAPTDDAKWIDPGPPAETVALGFSAHACVVTGTYPLEFGSFHRYDLRLTTSDGKTHGLLDTDVVVAKAALDDELNRFGGLPAFLTPPEKLEDLRIVYGSCRKANGQSVDALALMEALLHDTDRHPHQLLLLGDQIYADEVAPSFLDLIRHHAQRLFGAAEVEFGERLPKHQPPGKNHLWFPATAWTAAGLGTDRGLLLYKTPGWAAHKTDQCHLLFLHEFLVTYLLMFSPVLWGDFTIKELYDSGKLLDDEYPLFRPQLRQFKDTLPKVRRVLASIPTLMIGDDHEITDDWNIDSQWLSDLRACNLQARLVRNALCAYAIFQDWGNRPDLYDKGGSARPILDALTLGGKAPNWSAPPWLDDTTADAANLDRLLLPEGATGADAGEPGTVAALGEDGPPPGKRSASGGELSFDYILAYPSHRLVVLDTRTRRHFPEPKAQSHKVFLPQLIGNDSLKAQIPKSALPERLDLVVSATPIYGEPTVERLLGAGRARLGSRRTDQECWSVSPLAVDHVSRLLVQHPRTVVLSGDVHYSFALQMDLVEVRAEGQPTRARVVQLCASSLRREDDTARSANLANYWHGPVPGVPEGSLERRFPWEPPPDAIEKENTPERAVAPPGDETGPGLYFHPQQQGVERKGLAEDLKTPVWIHPEMYKGIDIGIASYVIGHNNFAWLAFSGAAGMERLRHNVVWVVPTRKAFLPPGGEKVTKDDEGNALPIVELGADYGLMCHEFEVKLP